MKNLDLKECRDRLDVIDKESVRQGENKLTGQPYRTYILFRIQRE